MITKEEILIKTIEYADEIRENIISACTATEIESNKYLRDVFL